MQTEHPIYLTHKLNYTNKTIEHLKLFTGFMEKTSLKLV